MYGLYYVCVKDEGNINEIIKSFWWFIKEIVVFNSFMYKILSLKYGNK